MPVLIIAAIGQNRAIGRDNKLLWNIPADLKRFADLTRNKPLVMGRKTFDSIIERNGKLLPGRPHVVVTRNAAWSYEGVHVAHTVPQALEIAQTLGEYPCVIGGENIFLESLRHAFELHLTLVDDAPDAHAYFPAYTDIFEEHRREPKPGIHGDIIYQWITYRRKQPA